MGKQIFSTLIGTLVFFGTGCFTTVSTNTPTTSERTSWGLQFNLPEGWAVTQGCLLGDEKVSCHTNFVEGGEAPTLSYEIDPEVDSIAILNTTKLPLFGGIGPTENEDAYQSRNVAQISVKRMTESVDTSSAVSVEDLGQGFTKVTTCDVKLYPECEIYGQWAHEYLFTVGNETYRFDINSVGISESVIENIVLSARPDLFEGDIVEGKLVASGFGGTEMGCGFAEDARVGDRMYCNGGWVGLAIQTDEGEHPEKGGQPVVLVDYSCSAREVLVLQSDDTKTVEYETKDCTGGLIQGNRYQATGTIDVWEDQWRNGVQVDIAGMFVQEVVLVSE